jgi:hypothetical protein
MHIQRVGVVPERGEQRIRPQPRLPASPSRRRRCTNATPYHDLGSDYFINRDNPDHRRRRAIAQLERLGYQVTLEPRAA